MQLVSAALTMPSFGRRAALLSAGNLHQADLRVQGCECREICSLSVKGAASLLEVVPALVSRWRRRQLLDALLRQLEDGRAIQTRVCEAAPSCWQEPARRA